MHESDCTGPDLVTSHDSASGTTMEPGNADGKKQAPSTERPAATHGYVGEKDAILRRLRRIEGQVRGVATMVESDTYCIEVLTQISAATSALQAVALELVDDHLRHCVAGAVRAGGEEADQKLTEASDAIRRLVKR